MILVIITYVLHRQFSFRRPSHTEALGSIAVVTGEIPVQAEDAQRTELARRFSHEILRLSMYGTMKAEAFPGVAERLRKEAAEANAR